MGQLKRVESFPEINDLLLCDKNVTALQTSLIAYTILATEQIIKLQHTYPHLAVVSVFDCEGGKTEEGHAN